MGVPKALGSDVQNFVRDVPNFENDVPRVRKCVTKWGSDPNHFFMGF